MISFELSEEAADDPLTAARAFARDGIRPAARPGRRLHDTAEVGREGLVRSPIPAQWPTGDARAAATLRPKFRGRTLAYGDLSVAVPRARRGCSLFHCWRWGNCRFQKKRYLPARQGIRCGVGGGDGAGTMARAQQDRPRREARRAAGKQAEAILVFAASNPQAGGCGCRWVYRGARRSWPYGWRARGLRGVESYQCSKVRGLPRRGSEAMMQLHAL